jgi:exopolysaccharide production protein ExoQ
MVGLIAAVLCLFLIWQLFRLSWESGVRTSKALWIPTFWLFIAASRNVSAWLQYGDPSAGDQYLEGSPLDRAVLTAVLALGVIVLLGRLRRTGTVLRSSIPILLYFGYCGISVAWSDFPDISSKRWFRALGDVVMVLIVLTDPEWVVAFRRLISRVGFVLLPLSILFIRYFPNLGRVYTRGGSPTWTGAATDKNALGMLALLCGLAYLFRFLELYRAREQKRQTGALIAQGTVFAMSLYLLLEAHSATAFSCFFLAGIPMVLTYLYAWARKPATVNLMVVGGVGIACAALFFNVGSGMLEQLGRDSTLTGRTAIWYNALGMVRSPLFGTGFESFWLGPRLAQMKVLIDQGVNQAHNGYVEIYLNLGWVGVSLMLLIIITRYFRIVTAVRQMAPLAGVRLAYFIVAVVYNFTEAGFKMMHPVWIAFLLAVMMLPEAPAVEEQPPIPLIRTERFPARNLEPARPTVRV